MMILLKKMGVGRGGGGGTTPGKAPGSRWEGGVRAVSGRPRECMVNQQSPSSAIDLGSVTYTACLRPDDCFPVRYMRFQ